jgi:hypothetical protein
MTSPPADAPRSPAPRLTPRALRMTSGAARDRARAGAAAVVAFGLVALAHGLLPGMINAATINYFTEASIRCTHDLGWSLATSSCHAFGEPVGFPLFTGGPLIVVGALLMHLPGVDSLGATVAAGLVFDALALAGGYALMRRLGVDRWIALGTATAYAASLTVVGMEGFGGTFVGYALLPAYAWTDLKVMDELDRVRLRRPAVLVIAYAVVRTSALFMDGYSFVASALVGACLWGAWLLGRSRPARRRATGAAAAAAANLVALVAYTLYVPIDYPTSPIEIFRAMGLDLVTLVVPSDYVWFASKLGIAADHADLWGDTSNAMYNYAGFACVGLAIYCVVRNRRSPPVLALAVAGAIALVMSLGPAVKVDAVRAPGVAVYAMPEGQAPELPWDRLLVTLPGLESMRATYRWFGVTRFALIVLAGLGVAQLARGPSRRRRLAAGLLAAVAVVELLPTMPIFVRAYNANYAQRVAFERDVAEPLDRATRDGERVFFLNYDGAHNDFLANYLASATGLRTYNVGGDKNLIYAMSNWPPDVAALAAPGVTPDAVEHALRAGTVDTVIAPFFHLQTNSVVWPPAPDTVTAAQGAFAPVLERSDLEVRRTAWFATIRLRP